MPGKGGRMDLRGADASVLADAPPGRNFAGISTCVSNGGSAACPADGAGSGVSPARISSGGAAGSGRAAASGAGVTVPDCVRVADGVAGSVALAGGIGAAAGVGAGGAEAGATDAEAGAAGSGVAGCGAAGVVADPAAADAGAAASFAASLASFCRSAAEGGLHTSRHMRSSTELRATASGVWSGTDSSRTMLSSLSTYTRLTVTKARLRQS